MSKKSKKKKKKLESSKKKDKRPKLPIDAVYAIHSGADVRMVSTLPSAPAPSIDLDNLIMPNSIAFSSDMTKLFLIDCDRSICFDLNTANGVMIGSVMGQIFAVSATSTKPSKKKAVKTLRLAVNKASQYTMMYNPDKVQLFVIGFDVIEGIPPVSNEPIGASLYPFPIKDHVIIIRRNKDVVEIAYSKR